MTLLLKWWRELLILTLAIACYVGFTRTVDPVVISHDVERVVERVVFRDIIHEVKVNVETKTDKKTIKPDGTTVVEHTEIVKEKEEATKVKETDKLVDTVKEHETAGSSSDPYAVGLMVSTDKVFTIYGEVQLGKTPIYIAAGISADRHMENKSAQAGFVYRFQ